MVEHSQLGSQDYYEEVLREPYSHQYHHQNYMGVSKNRGTPKWMVYNGKPY